MIVKCDCYRIMGNNFHFCEYAGDLEDDSAALNISPSHARSSYGLYVAPLSYLLSQVANPPHSLFSFIPVLTLRFAISLKKTADPTGGQEWQLKHFSTLRFAGGPEPGTERSAIREGIEVDHVDRSRDYWTTMHEQ